MYTEVKKRLYKKFLLILKTARYETSEAINKRAARII